MAVICHEVSFSKLGLNEKVSFVRLGHADVPHRIPSMSAHTEFERKLGISSVEVRPGFTQVHLSGVVENLSTERLRILAAVAGAGVSIDFLKLTQSGISFLVSEELSAKIESVLSKTPFEYSIKGQMSIVMVHAVNMRDEEGLIAKVVQSSIESFTRVDHVSDMHNRMLLVVKSDDADSLAQHLRSQLAGESA